MFKNLEVVIGIQARSNSSRFPGKIYEQIGDRAVLSHVIDQAESAAGYLSRKTSAKLMYKFNRRLRCRVAILHPENDNTITKGFRGTDVMLVSGDEKDVLSRYVRAQEATNADFVVRLTSDCPMVLDFVIVKHVHVAIFNEHDYVSNVEEKCRFVADGLDCEIMSKKALKWLDANAKSEHDREHVTTMLRRERPAELSQAIITSKLDTSHLKMSIDTVEDLERVRAYYHEREHKMAEARRIFGEGVYEL